MLCGMIFSIFGIPAAIQADILMMVPIFLHRATCFISFMANPVSVSNLVSVLGEK